MNYKALTIAVILGSAVAIAAYDFWVAWCVAEEDGGGYQATISCILLDAAKYAPIIALAFGVLMGHLFWPQYRKESKPRPHQDEENKSGG